MKKAFIVNVELLPLPIQEIIHTKKVFVEERDDGVLLKPIKNENVKLWGLLADGKLSSEKFLEQKRKDKELEN